MQKLQLSPAKKQRLIDIHALATESCQLLLVLLTVTDTACVVGSIVKLSLKGDISTTNAAFLIEAAVVGSFAIHAVAIFAVDLIEGRILLGTWTHSYKWQPFVLTRRCISVGGEDERMQQPGRGMECVEESHSREDMNYRMAKLNYLDLASLNQMQKSRKVTTHSRIPVIGTATTSGCSSTRSATSHRVGELPTPPDSDQLKETKRVKWAPTITVVSPSGFERRMSLP